MISARLELCKQEGGQEIGRQKARADVHPCVLVDFAAKETRAIGALFSQYLGSADERRIIDDERSALATGDVLRFVKAERGQRAERAEHPATILAEQPVRIVFDDGNACSSDRPINADMSQATPP